MSITLSVRIWKSANSSVVEPSTGVAGMVNLLSFPMHSFKTLHWCTERAYLKPETYRRVGGMKIFRDEIWRMLRIVFRADHKYYKTHGFYDFPQQVHKTRVLNAVVALITKIPAIRRRFYTKEIKPGMIRNLQRVVARI